MKNTMFHRLGAVALTAALAVSLMGSALAYTTPDFSDVPAAHWAYPQVMKMADAGVIKGTGEGKFSPADKLSAAMFITLVGRALYPEVKADGADWYGPYVEAARADKLLEGTTITDANLQGEVTRYDMAVILDRAAREVIKAPAATTDTSKITDYGDMPVKYADAVAQVYATGLIQGDQDGKFNGTNTMTRAEAATVMDRLIAFKAEVEANAAKPVEPEKPEETEPPVEPSGEMVKINMRGGVNYSSLLDNDDAVGAKVSLYYIDGTLLATAVTEEGGRYEIHEIDAAYYQPTGDYYYYQATYVHPDGRKFSNIDLSGWRAMRDLPALYNASFSVYDDAETYDLDF